jgi:predicted alpha/beta-hydrolase family hydrolase
MTWHAIKPESWDQKTAIVLAHGAGQGMDSPFMKFFHSELARRGFLSLQFNFEYMEAKRKFPDPLPKMQALYRQVVQEMAEKHRPQSIVIGGKSMGGRVASYIGADTPKVSGLVFLGYPLHPPRKPDQLRDSHLYGIHLPMLFLSGTADEFAERALLEQVVKRLGSRATLIWTEKGDHSLKVGKTGQVPLIAAAEAIEHWIRERI